MTNIKMVGIAEAAEETKCIMENSGNHVQIDYNTETGEVLHSFLVGQNEIVYSDDDRKNIIFIGDYYQPASAQSIANEIEFKLRFI